MSKPKREKAAGKHQVAADADERSENGAGLKAGPSADVSSEPLRFEVPFAAVSPRLINPKLGLASLVPSADAGASYTIDVTLLDSPDHRLIRSGILLAHRVRDGVGEWYLSAPSWSPYLAAEATEPMGQADLPQVFVDLVRPFRRIGALGPVAALTSEQRDTLFQDVSGKAVATVRDTRVTVRRGGLTTARFREVTITPGGKGLAPAQRTFLTDTLTGLGASAVDDFPPLAQRLGAPATGLPDYPEPRPLDQPDTLHRWLGNLIAYRLRGIVRADLDIRTKPDRPARASLARAAAELRSELLGLSDLLEPARLNDIADDLAWLAGSASTELAARLRGERYLALLEQLVNVPRALWLGDAGTEPAKRVLRDLLARGLDQLAARANAAAVDGPDGEWESVVDAAEHVLDTCAVASHLRPKPVHKVRERLVPLTRSLSDCLVGDLDGLREQAEAGDPAAAFGLGRQFEQGLARRNASRRLWLHAWSKQAPKLLA